MIQKIKTPTTEKKCFEKANYFCYKEIVGIKKYS